MEDVLSTPELQPFLRDSHYIDVKTIEGEVSLRQFIASMLSYYPGWIVVLYRIRKLLVALLGLVKHEEPQILPKLNSEEVSFTPGDAVTFFIVRSAKGDVYWISETPDDKHLSAYFCVIVENLNDGGNRFHVVTIVCYKHWTGPVYFNLIRPFHHLVVNRMMRAGVKMKV